MKKIIIACCIIISCTHVEAQEKWSLRQCIDYAIENNIDLKQQELNVMSSEINLSTSKNSRLPDLNGSVSQNFSFGRSTLTNNVTESVNASNTSFGLSTSLPLFTGFRIPNQIKRDELNLLAATEGLNKARENLELQIVSLYLDILFKKEILRVYIEQLDLSKQQVERTQTLVDAGKVPLSQLYDINAQQARDELNVTTANNDLTLSLLNLAQALNLFSYENFDIVEPDMENMVLDNLSSLVPPNHIYQLALGIKPHIKEAEYRVESSKKGLKVAQAGYWPTLNFGAGYSTNYQHISTLEQNRSFGTQFKDNGSEYLSFSLNIPIFNRFQVRNQVRSARLEIANQELALDNVKLALLNEIQQAYQSALGAKSRYSSTEKAYVAAQESFNYAQERYEVGKSTVFEFNEARTNLFRNQSEQIQAKYDFIFRTKILDFYQGKPIDIE